MPIEIIYKNEHCEWIDVESPTEEDLEFLHNRYNINSLLLEDTVDANHLPKFEQDGDVNFFLMRENTQLERSNLNTISDISTKLGVFLLDKVIITIHRLKNRSIYEFRKEILLPQNESISRDQIALNLALKVMKSYDDESKNLLETMDQIESEIFLKTTNHSNHIRRLYRLKRKSGLNTRILNISTVWVDKFKMLQLDDTAVTDLKDKHKDVIADFEHLNAQVASLISMFLAMSDQKANQVMKVLAIYSMYFFPITFIAGIYGMNFVFMPELNLKYGYYITLGLMATITVITFFYVRKKGW
ncbi:MULTISPECIES: CorA family divalent cation transporter [unclassified Kaistella]|uniref:magnesium transporter CorA family protein n=1 Tax=unclassified Kaistella TaxID=2762626 RepID=UPI002736BC18|nr:MULTISPECIES: CorA family divalent cation transporter [unclassified Kaistella]MDP2453968.1 CorA family divalent cation transporter [Kaistella sp. SH11-4b]MDP2457025.1 CorA family divalent cation transporter [Kaistella sp. SH40-3]MDP2459782.1 CorA family divalent cation transporter [Kaistella sp. SH19-2b]